MSQERLSILHPVAWLRSMLRLPGYVVAVRRRRRRLLAAVYLAVVALIWIGSSLPAMLLGPPPANASMHGFGEFLMLLLGRVLGNGYLCVMAAATGALAFAPERRSGAMDQLVMTSAPRGAVFLGRALGSAIPLIPAVMLAAILDLALLPMTGSVVDPGPLLVLLGVAATFGVTTVSMTIWSYSLGLLASLRSRTTTRALVWSLLLLPGVGLLEVCFYFGATAKGPTVFLACYWFFALLRVIFAALVMRLCARRFDVYALGEKFEEPGPPEFSPPRTP